MKKLLIIISLLSLNAWSKVNLDLVLESSKVKQGEIVVGKMVVRESQGQTALSGLSGLNLDETIYLVNVSPFIGKNGSFEAQVKLIFLKKPETLEIKKNVNGEEIVFKWTTVEVVPTEESKGFLLGDFEIPGRTEYLSILLGLLIIFSILFFTALFYKRFKNKKQIKLTRKKTIDKMLNCHSYEEIVEMWRKKQHYLNMFPEIENEFKELEKILFRYQFKPSQSPIEIEEIQKSYSEFIKSVLGVLNGV